MNIKELPRNYWLYAIIGVALLVLLSWGVLSSNSGTTLESITVDPSRYNLTTDYNQAQYDKLVAANNTLQGGFNFDAANAQATALFALKDYEEAEKAWQYFIANRPKAIQGYWGLGEIYGMQERYEDAEKNWLKAIEVDTPASYPNSYIKLADLYATVFPDRRYQIVQIVTAAMAKNPTEANYPLLLATYYRDIEDWESAIRFYEAVIKLEPASNSAENIRREINEIKAKQ